VAKQACCPEARESKLISVKAPYGVKSTSKMKTLTTLFAVLGVVLALANKMAAWNERRLVRDIYDIWFLLQMNATPDTPTLETRLRKPTYSRLVKAQDYFPGRTCSEFYDFIRTKVAELSEEQIVDELADYLSPEETTGLALLFRAALVKLA